MTTTATLLFFALLLSYLVLDALSANIINGVRRERRDNSTADWILMLLSCALWTAFYAITHP